MLKYTTPAKDWSEALPIGNGRLGAMIYGRTDTELLQLNEESIWYGGPQQRTPPDALRNLPRLRELIRAGEHVEAEKLVRLAFFATPASARHYEPLGTMRVELDHRLEEVRNYERSLDLGTAVMKVEYECNGVRHTREIIASYQDRVLAMRIVSSEVSRYVIRLTRVSDVEWETNEFLDSLVAVDGRLIMRATAGGNGRKICCVVNVKIDGEGSVEMIGNALVVSATKSSIAISASTRGEYDALTFEEDVIYDGVSALNKSDLFDRHIKDYQSLYHRMSLELFPDASSIPTNDRITNPADPGLAALYHNYSRYLLISCSRATDRFPANLQGIWSPSFQPAWGAKYTLNINLQMNYWPANPCNLAELETPLFELIESLTLSGVNTAGKMYGADGWCCHHNTDRWADTDPQDRWMPATLWPLGGAWLCTHIWESYSFSQDKAFLEKHLKTLRNCVFFLLDFLIPDSTGEYIVTNPSVSPENTFVTPDGVEGTLCEGSTIDIAIISAVFTDYLNVAKVLDLHGDILIPQVESALSRLPPVQISEKTGTIREWSQHDHPDLDLGHRHLSHLWALHPGHSITPTSTPALATAAAASLRRREAHGGGHTGWSRAALINLWARLGEGEECWKHVQKLLSDSTMPNMLDVHPPFQIDGNFGGGVGILEMLVQSEWVLGGEVVVRVLPACPGEWRRGRVKDVRGRGGVEVGFEWDEGVVNGGVRVVVLAEAAERGRVVFPSRKEVTFEGLGEHLLHEPT